MKVNYIDKENLKTKLLMPAFCLQDYQFEWRKLIKERVVLLATRGNHLHNFLSSSYKS
jgi:hypothetical protein